jgi:hypothetical protein
MVILCFLALIKAFWKNSLFKITNTDKIAAILMHFGERNKYIFIHDLFITCP